MNPNLSNAVPAPVNAPADAIPRKVARVRPNPNEGNPLLMRRGPRNRPTENRASAHTNKIPDLSTPKLGSKWAGPAARQEVKTTINAADWHSYKLVTTKASLVQGLRHHVIRMHPKRFEQMPDPMHPGQTIGIPRKVNLLDPNEFKRPIKIHRRDPSAPLGGVKETGAANLLASQQPVVHDEEKEARDLEQAKKAADRAEIESKIAPYGGAKKKKTFMKKTEQVFHHDAANAKMRYEESQPWFIEDFDNTNTWQGQREQNMSNGTFVALIHGEDGQSLRMIPIEKWYKFREVNKFKLSVEEAMEKKKKFDQQVPSWIRADKAKEVEEDEELTVEEQALYNKNTKLRVKSVFTTKGAEDVKPDKEEIDYEEDRFDNDDAGQVYGVEGDDDERKEIEKRIKKEQFSANALNCRDETLYDAEKAEQMKVTAATKKHGKRTKKALRKREGNYNYNSDSDSNPYASSGDSEDEDETLRRAEEHKKEVEAKLKAEEDKKAAEAAKEAQRQADATEKKLKAAEKRKEVALKKKLEKAQKGGELLAAPVALGASKKAKAAATLTALPPAVDEAPRNKKRPAPGYITSPDSVPDNKPPPKNEPPPKKFKKDNQVTSASNSATNKTPNGAVMNPSPMRPPAAKITNKKRKPDETELRETLENKRQKTKPETHKGSPSPPPETTRPIMPLRKPSVPSSTSAPITDEELKALLRSNPQGVTVKFITTAFKGRMGKSKEDIQKMVTIIKRVGKLGLDKKLWILKE